MNQGQDGRISPVIYLLFAGLVIFSGAALFCSLKLSQDNVTFNFFSQIAMGFFGTMTGIIIPRPKADAPPPPGTSVTTVKETERVTMSPRPEPKAGQ